MWTHGGIGQYEGSVFTNKVLNKKLELVSFPQKGFFCIAKFDNKVSAVSPVKRFFICPEAPSVVYDFLNQCNLELADDSEMLQLEGTVIAVDQIDGSYIFNISLAAGLDNTEKVWNINELAINVSANQQPLPEETPASEVVTLVLSHA